MGIRDEARLRTTAAILEAARTEIAEHGGGGLSMRRIARSVDLVPSAVYRYFPSRDELLTAMILESYGHLAERLEATRASSGRAGPATRWTRLSHAFRDWGREAPHEFQLIYGTPVPGYHAPPETVPAAAAVAAPLLAVGAGASIDGFDTARLRQQMAPLDIGDPSGVAAVLAELAALVGFVSLELAGHFVGSADPADDLYAALLARQVATLRLGRAGGRL